MSTILSPPLWYSPWTVVRFILSGLPFHRNLKRIVFKSFRNLLGGSGKQSIKYTIFDTASNFITPILQNGVSVRLHTHTHKKKKTTTKFLDFIRLTTKIWLTHTFQIYREFYPQNFKTSWIPYSSTLTWIFFYDSILEHQARLPMFKKN